jgi:hypothetical protein
MSGAVYHKTVKRQERMGELNELFVNKTADEAQLLERTVLLRREQQWRSAQNCSQHKKAKTNVEEEADGGVHAGGLDREES